MPALAEGRLAHGALVQVRPQARAEGRDQGADRDQGQGGGDRDPAGADAAEGAARRGQGQGDQEQAATQARAQQRGPRPPQVQPDDDGRALAIVRDAVTGEKIATVRYGLTIGKPIGAAVLADLDGNAVEEIAVFGETVEGRARVQIRRLQSGFLQWFTDG